eukprot:114151_1
MTSSSIFPDLPLHQFTAQDVCNIIERWISNDIIHTESRKKTQNIFVKHQLSGDLLSTTYILSTAEAKQMIQSEMLDFMTHNTFDIIFQCLEQHKNLNPDTIGSKSEKEIAAILYDYPLKKLIHKIENEQIDGSKIIRILNTETNFNDIIKTETGW